MKLAVLGDSITRGTYWEDGAYHIAAESYPKLLKKRLRVDELLCVAIDGVSISSTSPDKPENALCNICREICDADIVLIAGGTNDYGNSGGVELGEINDKEDFSFYGALEILYQTVQNNNPKGQIYVVLPIPRLEENVPNIKGYVLEDYRTAIEKKAREYGFFVIDTRRMPIDPHNEMGRKLHICDGLHPNQEGHKIYAKYIYNAIKTHFECEKAEMVK